MTTKQNNNAKAQIPYRQQLTTELKVLDIRINTLLNWLMNNVYAENFETTYEKYYNLMYKKQAKKEALHRLAYPTISKRIDSIQLPTAI